MGSEVYSWRVKTELKASLENEARKRKTTVSSILELAVNDWLAKRGSDLAAEEEQRRLHQAAAVCLGTIQSGQPDRSENVRQLVRERLRSRRGR